MRTSLCARDLHFYYQLNCANIYTRLAESSRQLPLCRVPLILYVCPNPQTARYISYFFFSVEFLRVLN